MRPQVRQQRHASSDALVEAFDLKVLIWRVVGLIGIGIRRHKGRHAQQLGEILQRTRERHLPVHFEEHAHQLMRMVSTEIRIFLVRASSSVTRS